MRIYVSTPVNARRESTFEKKRLAAYYRAETLRAYLQEEYPDAEVVTPFDNLPLKRQFDEPTAMGVCIKAVLECDTILLDRGWTASKGCNLEYRAAKLYGKHIIDGNGQIPE